MSSNILSNLKFIDMYAFLPPPTFGKDGKVYSRLGFLLTLVTIFIIGSMTIFLSIQVAQRKSPSYIQYQLPPSTKTEKIAFNSDTFPVKFMTYNSGDDLKYYEIFPAIIGTDKYYTLSSEECGPIQPQVFKKFHCVSQDKAEKDQSKIDNSGKTEFRVSLRDCQNSATNGNSCHSTTDLNAMLSATQYAIEYNDWLIDPTDYKNPIKPTSTQFVDYLMASTTKYLIFSLEEIEFTSDNGWIFEDLKTETHLRASITTQIKEKVTTEIITIQVQYTGNKIIYKRTYPKIQDLLAQISGFVTIIIPIFVVLTYPYAKLQTVQHLMNETYEIKIKDKQQNSLAKKKSKTLKSLKYQQQIDSKPNKETEAKLLSHVKESPQRPLSKSKTQNLQEKTEQDALGPLHTSVEISPPKNSLENLPMTREDLPQEILNISPIKGPAKVSAKKLDNDEKSPEKISSAKEEEDNEEKEQVGQQENEVEFEGEIPLRKSDKIQVDWTDWLRSFFRTEPRVEMLKQAEQHIMETIDLVTLSKKVVEIDKLKACLLTSDQRVLFDNLPPSMIIFEPNVDVKPEKAIKQFHWKGSYKGDEEALKEAYLRMKGGRGEEKIDKRLLKLYESEYLDDERIRILEGKKSL